MIPKTNLKQLAVNYNQKRKIDKATLNEIVDSVSDGLKIKVSCKILDIGCGSGRILLPLAIRNPSTKFIGLDVSEEMLNSLNTELSENKIGNITTIKHDASERLPFGDNEFDSVLLYHSYHIIKNKEFLAKEVKRILKPQGNLLIASTSHTQLATTLNYKYIPEMLIKEFQRTPDIVNVVKTFKKTGFKLNKMKEITIRKSFKDLDEWINFLKQRPISALTFFDDERLKQLLSKMKKNLESNFGNFAIEYVFDYHTQIYLQKI